MRALNRRKVEDVTEPNNKSPLLDSFQPATVRKLFEYEYEGLEPMTSRAKKRLHHPWRPNETFGEAQHLYGF